MASSSPSPSLTPGGLVFRLVALPINLNVGVVEGTSEAAMQAGAGHLPGSPLPGQAGNVVVIGHVRFFGRPFQRLGDAKPGEVMTVRLLHGSSFRYRVVPGFQGHGNPWTETTLAPAVVGQSGSLAHGRWLTLVTDPHERSRLTVLRLTLIG